MANICDGYVFLSVTHKKNPIITITFSLYADTLAFPAALISLRKVLRKKKVAQLQFSFAELVQFPARLQIH